MARSSSHTSASSLPSCLRYLVLFPVRMLLLLIGNFFIVLFLSMVYAFVPRGKLRQQMERRLAQVRKGQEIGVRRPG